MFPKSNAVLIFLALGSTAWAWGITGHRVVARLAAQKIPPATGARILAALDADSDTTCRQTDLADRLACVSTWADDVKRTTMRFTSNWHFVDIPRNESSYQPARDCRPTPRGDCLIQAVERLRTALTDPDSTATPQSRAEAVKFLVHFMGDLTQPLHCITDGDNGGNGKVVTWFGDAQNEFGHWNLHSVWDDGLISRSPVLSAAGPPEVVYTRALLARDPLPDSPEFSHDALVGWALESHDAGVKFTYGTLPDPVQGSAAGPEQTGGLYYPLGSAYLEGNIDTVELQLQRGGQRLAGLLNGVFGAANP